MYKTTNMLATEKAIRDLIKAGQNYKYIDGKYIDDYKPFIRAYSGKLRDMLEQKRTVDMALMVFEIEKILDIINPALLKEIEWFTAVSNQLKTWHDNKVKVDRLLGIKDYQGD